MSELINGFLGKKVRLVAKLGQKQFVYIGEVTAETETQLSINDRYSGVMILSKETIMQIQEIGGTI